MDEDGTAFGKGANEAAVDLAAQVMQMPGDSAPEGTSYASLCLKVSKVTNSSIKVKWKKVKGAKRYIFYTR